MIPQRDTWGRVVAAGVTVLAPTPLLAQAAAGVSTTPPPTWRLQLSADGTWYENAYFVGGPAASSWSAGGQATLSHQRSFRKGGFSLSGFGGMLYYPEIDDFNQPTYGGALGLSWAPSRRTQLRLGQTYQRSNTRYLRTLDVEGLPLPTSNLENASSTAGLVQELSASWQLALDGSFTWRRYDDERLVGGEQLFATAQLARRVGRHGSAYLGYGFSTSWLETGPTRSHVAMLGARKRVDRGASFEVGGGVGYMETTGELYPTGRAGLTAQGRRSTLALLYYREFGQAFGYGREVIGDLASASVGWTPVRRLTLNAGYNFGYRRDPADESYTIRSSVASAGFGWQIAKGLGLNASYGWERNDTEGAPVVEGGRVSASLSYGVDWR